MKIKRWISLLLAAVTAFAVTASGCVDEQPQDAFTSVPAIEKATYKGTHVFNAVDTDKDMVKNGASDYVIITPKSPTLEIQTAKQEFIYLFQKATGVELRALTDTGDMVYNDNVKYISIGKTSLLESAGIEIDTLTLGMDGYRVQTKGSTVFLYGGSDNGTLYSVYGFMQETFHFEAYWKDCIEIDTGISNLKLKNYDITDIPDIAMRTTGYGFYNDTSPDYDARNWSSRIKLRDGQGTPLMTMHEDFVATSAAKGIHNSLICLPKKMYAQEHPEWYSTAGNQLCYTARGDAEEFEAMTDAVVEKIAFSMKTYTPDKYPLKNTITVTMEDNTMCCACEKCLELKEKYDTEAGAVCIFINKVGEKVEQMIEGWKTDDDQGNDAWIREDFHIIFFAYNNFTVAPAKLNEQSGKWEPIDEQVVLRDNVGVYLAPINNLDGQQGIYTEVNDKGRENFNAWKCLTDYMWLWMYSTNFNAYMYYYDSFSFFNAEGYAYMATRGARYIFNQAQWNQTGAGTTWHTLKAWLDAKLMWDTSLSEQELMDKWFNAMYKEAAPIMKTWFQEVRSHTAKVYKENNLYITNSIYNKVDQTKIFPLGTWMAWLGRCNQAVESIEKYKTISPELYDQLVSHIDMEWLSPAFITLKLYSDSVQTEVKLGMIERFKRVVLDLGMTLEKDATGGGDLANAFDHLT